MLCERCKKNEAMIHVVKIINGKKSEAMLCEKCARELSDIPLKKNVDNKGNISFENMMNEFLGAVDKVNKVEVVCKNCGLTYSEFKKNGKLGCSECYDSFKDSLIPSIKRIQGYTAHVGKMPLREESKVIKTKKVKKLKEELQKAIVKEEYEKAAIIRDEIKLYESAKGSGISD